MSVAAGAAGGGEGSGGGDDERKKGMLEISDSNSWEVSSVEESGEEVESKRVDLSNYEAGRRLEFLRITKSVDAHTHRTLKRSLSTHYQGKSKSFGNLAELGTEEAKDLEKKEHPLNKRRRLQMAQEIRRRKLSGEPSCNIIRASSPHDIPEYDDDDDKKASDHDQDEDNDKKAASDHDEEFRASCNIIRASSPHDIPEYDDDDDEKASDHDQDEDDDKKKASDHDEDDEN